MTIALAIVATLYFFGACLIALNSALDAERSLLTATDLAVIALVSAAWPAVGCIMLLALAQRKLSLRGRELPSGSGSAHRHPPLA
ncbi:hypothetical protein ASE66_19670 [Bosea sp. Root483D1]|nr:hypothetical protein ASE66_19670 [Bosea sp. Root483D1]